MGDGPESRLVEMARAGNRRALADLVERCEPVVGHVIGYGLAGDPDPGGAAREVVQRVRRDVHQIPDPAGVRSWIAAQALWQVRHLRSADHVGAPVDGLGLSGETLRVAEAARRLTPQDRDTFAIWWLYAAGGLTTAEAGRVLGVDDPEQHGRRTLARLDSARTVLVALAASPICPTLTAEPSLLAQGRHVEGCPSCAGRGSTLPPIMPLLAAAGPIRLPLATQSAVLPLPRRPTALLPVYAPVIAAPPAPAEVDSERATGVEVTARLTVPATTSTPATALAGHPTGTDPATTALTIHPTGPATTALATHPTGPAATALATHPTGPATTALATHPTGPAATALATQRTGSAATALAAHTTGTKSANRAVLPQTRTARRRAALSRRHWRVGLAALAALALGLVIVVNLPDNRGPLTNRAPSGTARALDPTSVASFDPGVPVTMLPAATPSGTVATQPGGVPGPGPATRPGTQPPAAGQPTIPGQPTSPGQPTIPGQPTAPPPAILFSDDFESGSAAAWTTWGGSWAVISDGGRVLRQGNPTPGVSREVNGSPDWADYSLRATVKPLSFGSPGQVGIAARVTGPASYYRLGLTDDGRAVLQAYAGSNNVTTLASTFLGVRAGTWHDLRIDVSGNTVTGYVDGRRIGSGTGNLAGRGRIGLQTSLATAEFDNVTVSGSR